MKIFLRFGYAIPLWAGIIGAYSTGNNDWHALTAIGVAWACFVIGFSMGVHWADRIKEGGEG